eukprot:2061448-Rhodomonas_salina.1
MAERTGLSGKVDRLLARAALEAAYASSAAGISKPRAWADTWRSTVVPGTVTGSVSDASTTFLPAACAMSASAMAERARRQRPGKVSSCLLYTSPSPRDRG